jgi:hypothetical protein
LIVFVLVIFLLEVLLIGAALTFESLFVAPGCRCHASLMRGPARFIS